VILLLLALSCAPPDSDCANVRDLGRSEASLVVTEAEHGVGWAREECAACHSAATTHSFDCVRAVEIDLVEVREAADFDDPQSCVPCHGANGALEKTP
jgi:hypothetical protein